MRLKFVEAVVPVMGATARVRHGQDHGFVRPASWADEYRRIFELFEINLVGRKVTGGGK